MPRLTGLSHKALTETDVGRTLYDDAGRRGEVRRGDESIVVAFSFRKRFDGKVRKVPCCFRVHRRRRPIAGSGKELGTRRQAGITGANRIDGDESSSRAV